MPRLFYFVGVVAPIGSLYFFLNGNIEASVVAFILWVMVWWCVLTIWKGRTFLNYPISRIPRYIAGTPQQIYVVVQLVSHVEVLALYDHTTQTFYERPQAQLHQIALPIPIKNVLSWRHVTVAAQQGEAVWLNRSQ